MKKSKEQMLQLMQEVNSWKRLLEFIQLENTVIKTRIAEITAGDISKDNLAIAEDFQQRCIRKDELIEALKNEVQDFATWLDGPGNIRTTSMLQYAHEKQRQLRSDIKILSQRFHQLKFSFHDFVAENF